MKKIITSLVLLCFIVTSSWAVYAPRAMGMGGAFTAIADDAYAAYWNPAGLAINPGVELSSTYQINNRNQAIGDNSLAVKGCFEIGMNPFAWMAGVGLVSLFALEGAKYLSDQGVVKKGWGRSGQKTKKEESMATQIKEKGSKKTTIISKKKIAKKAVKTAAQTTIKVGKEFAKAAISEAARQTRHYYAPSPWYRPSYYRPNYWDYRYDYRQRDLTPAGKAQFAAGLTVMQDKNATLDQDTNWYSFTVASGWEEIVALGASLNVYDLKIPSSTVKGFGAGLDVGALLRINNVLMLGLTAKELLTTDIKWENGAVTRYQTNVNVGAAIKPIRQVTIAGDIHNTFAQNGQSPTMHYGIEVRPVYGVAFRGGLDESSKTAGLSLGVGQAIVDYAYLGGTFNRTQTIGVSWKI